MTDEKNYEVHTYHECKHNWIRTMGVILATLIGSFLAFYFVADRALDRITDPEYNIKKMEKFIKHQEKSFRKFEDRAMDSPFEPRMSPMLVNLVKEPNEYKVIVDLKPVDGNEKNISVDFNDNIVIVKGEIEKKEFNMEKIVNFSQSFYLDEHIKKDKIKKEVKGNKYIITIPY